MSKVRTTVTGVYIAANGWQMLNTEAGGGPDGTPGVINTYQGAYFPQSGDQIYIEDAGGGVWVVAGWLTPNRGVTVPVVPVEEVANAAPGGWTQISTVFTEPGVTVNPRKYYVPSTVVIPPPPSAPSTLVRAPFASAAYRHDFGGSWQGGRLYQGSYGGFGPWDGAWFYPDMAAALSGHTVTGIRIRLHRANEGGSAGAVQTHLYLHNHASQPIGAPVFVSMPFDPIAGQLGWNIAEDVTLPLLWAQLIQSGAAKGVGISGSDQDTYSILVGVDGDAASGQLSIDYT